jgi:tetratricopeptide (TPR) repeat protein
VFWLHASSSTRLETSVREMAEFLKLPGRDEPQVNILQLFGYWLLCSGSQWLLVIDNADSEDVLFHQMDTGKRPLDYLFVPTRGQIILTTRYRAVALRCLDPCDVITVGPMEETDAVHLFRKKTEQTYETTGIEELVEALDRIPLAVAQAAAYTKSFVPPCSIAVYLAKLNETNKSDASLLKANFNELRRDPEASNSVITTWQISFEHIRKIRPSAANRLALMSFFDHRGIPKTLLHMDDPIGTAPPFETSGLLSSGSVSGSEAQRIPKDTTEDIELERDVSMLHDFHLLAVKVDTNDLEMHPLVHLSALKWLESHGKRDEYMYKSMKALSYALDLPTGDKPSDHVLQWKKYYPHVQLALNSEPKRNETWRLQLGILEGASSVLFLQHRYAEAEILDRRIWVECKRHFLDEHPSTLISETYLGGTLMALGKYEDAFAMFEHVLGVAERQFETDRSDVSMSFLITCLNYIGRLECKMERFVEAEAHLRRALDYIGDSDSDEHKRVLCTEELVGVLQKQQKHQEAKNMCDQLLEFCTKTYGRDHRYVLASSRLLAELLQKEGKLDEASEVLQQGLEAVNPGPALDHIDIWHATMSLLSVLGRQKKMREVADLLRRSMENFVKFWGEEHIFVLDTAYAYALVLTGIGEHYQAIDVMRSCATTSRRVLGPDHEKTVEMTQYVMQYERELGDAEESQAAETLQDAHQ